LNSNAAAAVPLPLLFFHFLRLQLGSILAHLCSAATAFSVHFFGPNPFNSKPFHHDFVFLFFIFLSLSYTFLPLPFMYLATTCICTRESYGLWNTTGVGKPCSDTGG